MRFQEKEYFRADWPTDYKTFYTKLSKNCSDICPHTHLPVTVNIEIVTGR